MKLLSRCIGGRQIGYCLWSPTLDALHAIKKWMARAKDCKSGDAEFYGMILFDRQTEWGSDLSVHLDEETDELVDGFTEWVEVPDDVELDEVSPTSSSTLTVTDNSFYFSAIPKYEESYGEAETIIVDEDALDELIAKRMGTDSSSP